MNRTTTRNGVTTIKGRGVTVRVNDRELDKIEAEKAPQRAAEAERSRVFGLMDAVSQAKVHLQGTAQVMTMVIDARQGMRGRRSGDDRAMVAGGHGRARQRL